ncbi:spore coat protein, partial [Flavobacterium sp. IR1]
CIGETKMAVAVNPDGMIEEFDVEDDEFDDISDEEYAKLDPNFLHKEMDN